MQLTINSTEIETFCIKRKVAELVRKNKIYQIDGKNDRYLVAEIQREIGLNTFSDTITRRAREIRRIIKKES